MNGRSLLWVLCLCAQAGCATTPTPDLQSREDAETTFDGLVKGDNTIMDSVLDEETKAYFEAEIGKAFSEEVSRTAVYQVVDEPAPDVLQIGVALLDVVSRVPPQAATQPRVYIESMGEPTLVLEVRGSMSNTVYLRAVERRAAQQQSGMIESNRVSNAAEIRRLGRRWGTIVREGLESLLTGETSR